MALTAFPSTVRLENVEVRYDQATSKFTVALHTRVALPFGSQRVVRGTGGLDLEDLSDEATYNTLIGLINDAADEILGG